ncbi:hypothetical protein [Sinisalibacter aestuarii]|uniref:Tetratricopeptide repeat protein n=1 Tax=Sinisalibacter aestuarii TaxID=2949426 RepID=A0ABQ5LR70_9RHOB|nr:hypothetical protein [Sinisalibacter aestuarii]GKY87499.1 hypothetical protein STA1M1_13680 [Sinisalibacter aestuarii]
MIGPILRLVVTYLVLIAAVVAVFNRDRLGAVFGGDDAPPVAVAPTAPAPAPEPAQPAPVTEAPAQAPVPQEPVYGSDLQMPSAAPAPQAAAPQAAAEPSPMQAPAAPATDAAVAGAINAARQAYWSGDIEGARAQMQALAAAHPESIEIAGELGNLHFALQDYPAAAEAWHRAGLLMIGAGQGPRLMSLLPGLRSIDPDKAADLAARLQGR